MREGDIDGHTLVAAQHLNRSARVVYIPDIDLPIGTTGRQEPAVWMPGDTVGRFGMVEVGQHASFEVADLHQRWLRTADRKLAAVRMKNDLTRCRPRWQ